MWHTSSPSKSVPNIIWVSLFIKRILQFSKRQGKPLLCAPPVVRIASVIRVSRRCWDREVHLPSSSKRRLSPPSLLPPVRGWFSPGSPLFSGRARGNAERSTVCAVCIRSHDGGIPGKKALPLHAFVTAKNVHSGRLGIHDPTCVPRTDGRSWINYTEKGGRKGEEGGERDENARDFAFRDRGRVSSSSWSRLFPPTEKPLRFKAARALVDYSWNRFSLFMRFLYYHKRKGWSFFELQCNVKAGILKTLPELRFFIEGVVILLR